MVFILFYFMVIIFGLGTIHILVYYFISVYEVLVGTVNSKTSPPRVSNII